VCANGQRVVLDLRLAGVESEQAWLDAVRSLSARHLGAPRLAVIDGNPGLAAALKMQWPQLAIQRCTNHKLWNLLAKAPAHLREELAEDYRRMIYAASREGVEQARVGFLRNWKLRCKAVGASFEKAGDELFTFTSFPSSQWKALRTTNALERINEEFRRRTKTQASLPSEEATKCKPRHRHQAFRTFLKHLDRNVPADLEVHLIADNYATHKHPRVKAWLARHPRCVIHYTPTYASWLNQVERWFGLITQHASRCGSFRSVRQLVQRIDQYLMHHNRHCRPFAWTATADSIFAKLQRLCKLINGTSH